MGVLGRCRGHLRTLKSCVFDCTTPATAAGAAGAAADGAATAAAAGACTAAATEAAFSFALEVIEVTSE